MSLWHDLPPLAQGIIGFGGFVLALMVVVDLLPGRVFYSRRAFEPPVRTWAEQPPLEGWELRRPPSRGELEPRRGRRELP